MITLSALPPSEQDKGCESTLALSGVENYIERTAPLGSRNSSLYALVTAPKGLQSQSRDYPEG